MARPTPCECIDDRGWNDKDLKYQLRFREAHILDLGGGQWVVICLESGRLIGAEVFAAFPTLAYTAQLRANGYRVTWQLIGSPAL